MATLLSEFCSFYTGSIIKCLRAFLKEGNTFKLLFDRTNIFDTLFEATLLITQRRPQTSNKKLSEIVRQKDMELVAELNLVLGHFNRPMNKSLISEEAL